MTLRHEMIRARTLEPIVMHTINMTSPYIFIQSSPEQYPTGTMVWVTPNRWLRQYGPWGSDYTAWITVGGSYRSRITLNQFERVDDGMDPALGRVAASEHIRAALIVTAIVVVLLIMLLRFA